jgi:hypothetical protein
MIFKFFTKALIVLFISIFFINCSSESEVTPENLEVHDFVWKGLNAYYLWQSDTPNLADPRFSNQGQLNSFLQEFS